MSDRTGEFFDDDDLWSDIPEPTAPAPRSRRPGGSGSGPPTGDGPAEPPGRRGQDRSPGPSQRGGPRRPPRPDIAQTPGRGRTEPADPSRSVAHPGPVPATVVTELPSEPDDGYEYVELPREGSVPRWIGVLVIFVLLIGAVVGGAWWWYNRQINPPGGPGDVVMVEVPQGASTSGIASILDREGVIGNSMVFNFYASRNDAGPYEAGVYELRENSDFDLVLDTLADGPTAPITSREEISIAIPEGLTVEGLLERVGNQATQFEVDRLEAALEDGEVDSPLRPEGESSYEGLLFPATYDVAGATTEAEFLSQLTSEMGSRVNALDVEATQAELQADYGIDLSAYDLLKVASMIQAEAGNPDEAARIATVIYNRLAIDMPLGIDAVDRYGAQLVGETVDYEDTDAPYNTRRNAGLPPTPIGAPGDFALDAAFNPADGPWMYYVLTEERAHTFSVTLEEHNVATATCRERNLGCG